MDQKSSIIERLKIAWYALTLKNYIYIGIKEEPALFDNDGNYVGIVNGSIKSYSYIDDTIKYSFDSVTSLYSMAIRDADKLDHFRVKDVEKDRLHEKKKNRPLSKGSVSKKEAIILIIVLAIMVLIISSLFDITSTAPLTISTGALSPPIASSATFVNVCIDYLLIYLIENIL